MENIDESEAQFEIPKNQNKFYRFAETLTVIL